ncbi:hypothetical protein [Tellurirhabdus rosea]|uniref:hypothetical protein n=1 Tax=Tellurirhabdus rosea TaxID=2674997 RepID=UPI0022595589|nr:hypothetical protein [Tellurirhabdus rosea]
MAVTPDPTAFSGKIKGRTLTTRSLSTGSGGLSYILLALPVLVFGAVFFRYALDIAKWDDHVLKVFLLNFEKADTFFGKVDAIVRQHNEHRIILDRLAAGLDFLLFGKLNYVHLMVVGNLTLVGLLILFARALRRAGLALWTALPVSLLLFNLSHWENMYWGMAALQNFSVVFLVVTALYRFAFRPSLDWQTVVLALLATATSGNGLVIWPLGLGLLLLKKDFPGTMRWLLAAVLCIRIYFVGYQKPPGNPPPKGSLAEVLEGWLAFNGAGAEAFPFGNPYTLSLGLGAALTALTVLLLLIRLRQFLRGRVLSGWDLLFLGVGSFVLGTGLIVAYSRAGFGLETLITSRYKIYSLLLLALTGTYVAAEFFRKKAGLVSLAMIGFSFLLALFSYSSYLDDTVFLRKYLSTMQFNWTYTQNRPVSTIDATTRRLVNPAPAFYDACLPELFTAWKNEPTASLDTLIIANRTFTLQSATSPALGVRDEGAYLLARSAQRIYLLPTRQNLSGSRRAWLQPGRIFGPGFTAQITEAELDKGRYDLAVLLVEANGRCRLQPTGKVITSSGQKNEIEKNW